VGLIRRPHASCAVAPAWPWVPTSYPCCSGCLSSCLRSLWSTWWAPAVAFRPVR